MAEGSFYRGLNNLFLGEKYYPVGATSRPLFTLNDFILDDAEKYIENDYEHAKMFLHLINDSGINIFEQLRLLKTIAKLYELCTSHYMVFNELRMDFYQAMLSLKSQADDKLASYFEEPGEFVDDISSYYAYNPYLAGNHIMVVAREHAIFGMVGKFAEQLSGVTPYKGDVYGNCSLVLQGPAPKEFANALVGEFLVEYAGRVARCYPRPRDRFGIIFYDLDQFGNRLSLMIAAHNAAAPILQEGLKMKAIIEWSLAD